MIEKDLKALSFLWEGADSEKWVMRKSTVETTRVEGDVLSGYSDAMHRALLARLPGLEEMVALERGRLVVGPLRPEEVSMVVRVISMFPGLAKPRVINAVETVQVPTNVETGDTVLIETSELASEVARRMKRIAPE